MGAGVARDAALRGLKVALVEKYDFASGTSSRSSKLIHGGLRYLEQCRFRLVREACRERGILLRIAPHLVRPLSILLPVYRDSRRSLGRIRAGLWLYDHIAGERIQPHRILSWEETLAEEPSLFPEGLMGGALFFDCQEDDARLVIENLMAAADAGACVANYIELIGFIGKDRLVAAQGRDRQTGGEFHIAARSFVNAAGNMARNIARKAGGDLSTMPQIRHTKGAHILLPRLTRKHGLLLTSPLDGRVFFALPWSERFTLVGTTDTDDQLHGEDVYASGEDVRYLLNSLARYLPKQLRERVLITFAGLRALADGGEGDPSRASRKHQIVDHGNGMFSLVGGKFTTYRWIAEQTTDRLMQLLGRASVRCVTGTQPLPIREVSVAHAVRDEMALTLTDVMKRRLGLFLSEGGGREQAGAIAAEMQPLLGWSDAERQQQVADYLAEVERNLPQ